MKCTVILAMMLTAFGGTQSNPLGISNMEKILAHFEQVEARQRAQLDAFERGTTIWVRTYEHREGLPMKTSDIREHFRLAAVFVELQKGQPDIAAAEKQAEVRAAQFIRSCEAQTDVAIARLKRELEQTRMSRLKAKNRLDSLKVKEAAITGTWKVRITDPYAWYDYRWEVTSLGNNLYRVEQTLLDTNHGFHKSRVGEKFHPCTLVWTESGEYRLSGGDSSDPNPATPGAFKQTGTLKLAGKKLTGKGTHVGGGLTNALTFEGERPK